MSTTVWFRLVTATRKTDEEILSSKHGRFHDDPKAEPTSYLADSPETAIREVQGWLGVPLNPRAFELYRATIESGTAFHEVSDPVLLTDPAPERCKEEARSARRSRVPGIQYPSVRNKPDGVCLAVFLEHKDQQFEISIELVPRQEWEALA